VPNFAVARIHVPIITISIRKLLIILYGRKKKLKKLLIIWGKKSDLSQLLSLTMKLNKKCNDPLRWYQQFRGSN